jgi:L-seryl-tRNA(Ser) seleniumtransferase
MLATTYEELRARATGLVRRLKALGLPRLKAITIDGQSRVGGGALPLAAPRTRLVGVEIEGLSASRLEQALRAAPVPVIARLEDGRLVLDVRTLVGDDVRGIVDTLARLAS